MLVLKTLVGSIWLILSIIPISIILGIGTAIYLEEYARDNILHKS